MRQQDTGEKRKWKNRLKYLAGIFALAATVVIALILPDVYSRWQDAKTMGEVVLSQRDGIQFLDTDALDISARLKMLGESSSFYYTQGMTSFFNTYYEDPGREELVEKCRDGLEKWKESHLVPKEIGEAARMEEDLIASYYYVQIDAGMIPVVVLCFMEDPYLEVIMDADNGFLYYVGCSGDAVNDYFYACMGVDSEEELAEEIEKGTYSFDQVRDISWYQFTELAGADSQEMIGSDFSGIFLNVRLQYEDFTSMAYRTMFEHYSMDNYEYGIGLAVMFGSRNWADLAMESVNLYYGGSDWTISAVDWIAEWNEMALSYGRDDLLHEETEMESEAYSDDGLIIDGITRALSEEEQKDISTDKK